ncbi:hypothetical protein [Longispora albida]|uniref:hypothetical protein n=1 Tax=Longispora albida TaxID=203523 RepID=UPI00036A1CF8|nr:hypothetical protein [Longispora albida]
MKPEELARAALGNLPVRMLRVSWLPAAMSALLLLALLVAGRHESPRWAEPWKFLGRLTAAQVVTLILSIAIIVVLTHPLQLAVVRMLEGYLPAWAAPLGRALRAGQLRRRTRLEREVLLADTGLNLAMGAQAVVSATDDQSANLRILWTGLSALAHGRIKGRALDALAEAADALPGYAAQARDGGPAEQLDSSVQMVREITAGTPGVPGPPADRRELVESTLGWVTEFQSRAGLAARNLRESFPRTRLLPTRLGNILASAEQNAGGYYGWDAVVTWPRMYPVLDPRVRDTVDGHRDALDAAARFAVAAAGTAITGAAILIVQGHWRWLPLVLLPLCVAWVSYRGAVAAAQSYSLGLYVAFDLGRLDLIRSLRLEQPADLAAERLLAGDLCAMWREGTEIDLRYSDPDAEDPAKE